MRGSLVLILCDLFFLQRRSTTALVDWVVVARRYGQKVARIPWRGSDDGRLRLKSVVSRSCELADVYLDAPFERPVPERGLQERDGVRPANVVTEIFLN